MRFFFLPFPSYHSMPDRFDAARAEAFMYLILDRIARDIFKRNFS